MSKLKKIIIGIIFIVIICLIIYFSKDYIIRQYFIAKIENVDYDEYILTTSYNGKKTEIRYYIDNMCYIRKYNEDEELTNIMQVYDYDKSLKYQYDMTTKECVLKKENDEEKSIHINNIRLLNFLKNEDTTRKFIYEGIKEFDNKKFYVLVFEKENYNTIFYLDKNLLYVIKECSVDLIKDKSENIIFEYDIDFEMKMKNIFEIEIN